MSVDAPERIWASTRSQFSVGRAYAVEPSKKDIKSLTEYVRADKLEELAAEVAHLRKLEIDTYQAWKKTNAGLVAKAEAALAEKDKEIEALNKKFETLKQAYDRERRRPVQILGSNAGGNDDE